jgi:hypothetical protein
MDMIILGVLLLIYSRLYQSAFFTAIVFIVILFLRFKKTKEMGQRAVIIAFMLMALGIFAINIWTILFPLSPENREYFLFSLVSLAFNPVSLITLFITIVVFIQFSVVKKWLFFLSLAIPMGYLIYNLFFPGGVSAVLSFGSRTNTITLLPVLILLSIAYRKLKPGLSNRNKMTISFFLAAMLLVNIIQAGHWKKYKEDVKEVLAENTGYVAIENTKLRNNPYRWSWNNSQIGMVWSYPCVKSIIINDKKFSSFPFDPQKTLLLKNYLKYDPVFASIDPAIQICESDQ